MAEEKLASGLSIDEAATVHLDSQSGGKIVRDQKFVGGIFKGTNRPVFLQDTIAQNNFCVAKIAIRTEALVWVDPQCRAAEVKD
jgi:hypothetical protein